ncbi:MAG TPA: hypothetical protein VN642_11055 [Dongiaceae bacterium]|nr:hypothetical protein [Dongiaceae bacterium]
MKRFRNLLLSIFVSPELVVVLLVVVGLVYSPEFMGALGKKLKSDSEVWKYMPTLTLLFSGAAFGLSSKIRAPLENSSNKLLYEWPLYPLLVDRVLVSMAFACICGATGLLLWVFGQSLSATTVGCVFLAATGVSATTAFTMLLAHQKLREIIDRYGTLSKE